MATSNDCSRSIIAVPDEVKDILCEPCEQDGKQMEAEGFCVDCPEYLCGQCYKNHIRHRSLKDHVLKDKDDMPPNVTGSGVKDVCVPKCAQHPDEIIKFFCGSCDSFGCSTCMFLDHRQCRNVVDIPKIVTLQETKEECLTFIKEMEVISDQIQERKNTVKLIAERNDDLEKEAKTELKRQREAINKFFDDLEADMDKKIEELHNRNETILTKAAHKYDRISNDLLEIKAGVKPKQNVGRNCEVCIAIKRTKSNLKAIEKEVLKIEENKIQKCKLYSSNEIQDMMKKITKICRIERENIFLKANTESSNDNKQPQNATKVFSTQLQHTSSQSNGVQSQGDQSLSKCQDTTSPSAIESSVQTLNLEKKIGVGTGNDKEIPRLSGLTVVHNHFIIAADGTTNH